MGSISKRANGYRAQVCVNGKRASKTLRTKALATAWLRATEAKLADDYPEHTVADLFDRYQRSYTRHKRTAAAEAQRCARLARELGAQTHLAALSRDVLARWRDEKLAKSTAGTVRRDWALLNHALNIAATEWQWIRINPLAGLARPKKAPPRTRVWTGAELAAFLHAAGHPGDTRQARVGDALLFALETGMRAGEITRIRPDHVHDRHVHIPLSKNGSARDVPLSSAAKAILDDVGNCFDLTDSQLNSLFAKARARAALTDLRFHDARRTALTRLATKFDALALARISGHKDLRILLDTYYAPSIDDLAAKLD